MSRASALALLLRRERFDLAAVGLVTLLVAFTAFVSVAGIRMLERAADDGLRRQVDAAPVVQRMIRFSTARSESGQEPAPTLADWQVEGEQLRTTLPEPLRALLADGNMTVGSVRLAVANPPDFPLFITLRYQDSFEELAELVAGRWPASTNAQLPPVVEFEPTDTGGQGWPTGIDHSSDEPRRFEIAVQEATARELGLSIGSALVVGVDYLDTLLQSSIIGRADVSLAPTELEITGLYRVRDPQSDAWFGDPELRFDDLGNTGTALEPVAYITAYVSPDGLPGLVSSALPFEYQWRFPIMVDRLDAGAADDIRQALRILEAGPADTEASEDVTVTAGLLPLLERHRSLRAASEAVLGLAASAPLALAGGAIGMAAVLLTRRRRAAMILARGRGASGRLLLAANLSEAVVVAGVACLAGLGLAIALEPASELEPSLVAAVSIGFVAIALLGGLAWPQIAQPLGDLERGARPPRRMDPRRLVVELTVVALAVVGAYVLRQRGIAAAGGGFDPFLAAVPPLIALAAGIVAVRAYRPLMAATGWLANRRRDLVPVLGVRTVARGAVSSLPALVLLLAVAFAAFSSVVSTSVDQAQRHASWMAVGGDVRLEARGLARELPPGLDPSGVPGVEATARGFIDTRVRAPTGTRVGTLMVHAVDAAAYAAVVTGSPIEHEWPSEFLDQPGDGPLPAIVGPRLTGGQLGLGPGDKFQIVVLGRRIRLEVVEARQELAGLTAGDSFAIVPYAWLEHAMKRDVPPSLMWIRAPAESVGALRDHISAHAGTIDLASRYDAYVALRNEPLVGAVGAGFGLAFGISVAYAVLTILGAVILSVGRRTRDLAVLRTLGLNGRQQTRLTMVEHVPSIMVALLPGIALGIGVASAVAPGLGLGAFSGSGGDVPLAIDWPSLAALSAALAALALAAVVIGSWLSRREAVVNALRMASD